jgi:hypothetical protein
MLKVVLEQAVKSDSHPVSTPLAVIGSFQNREAKVLLLSNEVLPLMAHSRHFGAMRNSVAIGA